MTPVNWEIDLAQSQKLIAISIIQEESPYPPDDTLNVQRRHIKNS